MALVVGVLAALVATTSEGGPAAGRHRGVASAGGAFTPAGGEATALAPAVGVRPRIAWQRKQVVAGPPVVTAGRVILPVTGTAFSGTAATPPGLVALDQATGEEAWRYELPTLSGRPRLVGGVVMVASFSQQSEHETAIAVDSRTGRERWRLDLGEQGSVLGAVGGDVGVIDRRTGLPALLLLDPLTGKQHRSVPSRSTVPPAPAPDGKTAFLSDVAAGSLEAVDLATGRTRWTNETNAPTSQLTIVDDTVVGLRGEATVVGVDLGTGTRRWMAPVEGEVEVAPVGGGRVLVVDSTHAAALAVDDGSTAWELRSAAYEEVRLGLLGFGLVDAGGRRDAISGVFDESDRLEAALDVDLVDGVLRWTHELRTPGLALPAAARGQVYVGEGAELVGLDAGTGAEVWRQRVDGEVVDLVPFAGGVVVVRLDGVSVVVGG